MRLDGDGIDRRGVTIFIGAQVDAERLLQIEWFWYIVAGTALYTPTLVQINIKRKPFKIFARLLLGVSIVLLWFGAIIMMPTTTIGIALRCIFVSVFLAVATVTLRIRHRHSSCEWSKCASGGFPFCNDNLKRMSPVLDRYQKASCGADACLAMVLNEAIRDSRDARRADIEIIRSVLPAHDYELARLNAPSSCEARTL